MHNISPCPLESIYVKGSMLHTYILYAILLKQTMLRSNMSITRSLGKSIMLLFLMLYSLTCLASAISGNDKVSNYKDTGKKLMML